MIPTNPVVLSIVKIGELVPTENNELEAGVVDPTDSTPRNEEVAVVEVARYAAAVGVDVETMFPLASVETSMFAPIPESVKLVAFRFVAKRLVEVALVVVPFVTVKAEIVDEAFEMKPARVGSVANTRDPEPVSSVTRVASSDDVSIDVLDTLLLKTVQSAEARQPKTAPVAVSHVNTPALFDRPEPVRSENLSELSQSELEIARLVEVALVVVPLVIETPLTNVVEAPVQTFWLERLRDATTAPVVGEMVRVPSEFDTEDTPVTRQVPFRA